MSTRTHFIVWIILLAGCIDDAPRDNPLDPLSSGYVNEGSLTGRIMIANQQAGVAGAIVSHLNSGIFVTADSQGYFSFPSLKEGTHRFACVKENFTSDTFQVDIQSRQSVNIVRTLNGAPVVLFQSILTRKVDYVSFSPKYFVDITANVTDPNGLSDLDDSVWFQAGDSLFLMNYDLENFVLTLDKSKFPTNTIQWLVAETLYIVAKDKHSAVNTSNPFSVSRIIENTSMSIFPTQDTTLNTDSVYFRWSPPDITFNYTSTVTVYERGTENIVATYPGLISFYEQYPIDGSVLKLAQGNYFWTVSIVDNFGNYSRSKESYFVVK